MVAKSANFKAGFELLTKFQNQWEHVHHQSENNVTKVRQVLDKLDTIEERSVQRVDALNSLILSYRSLARLSEQIESIEYDLRMLEKTFPQIEDLLTVMKNHHENVATSQAIEVMNENLTAQIREERCLSDARKERLKIEHKKRIDEYELEQQRQLDERRLILEKAFEEEKNRYLQEIKQPKSNA